MIKINYLIERDEGDEIKTYTPDLIQNEIPNVAYIQGPNSAGKSTLLNLIALAFYGNKLGKDEINQSLKNRIENLINSDHQKLKFNIVVENDLMGIKLTSTKESLNTKDIKVRKKDKDENFLISADRFQQEFKLIYDIPNNPLERLPNLLIKIRNDQRNVKYKLSCLRDLLREIISEIQDAKDPGIIKKLKENIEEKEKLLKMRRNGLKNLTKSNKLLKKYYFSRFTFTYKNKKKKYQSRINLIKKEERKFEREQSRAFKASRAQLEQLETNISQAESLFDAIKEILPKLINNSDKNRYKMWADSDIRDEIIHPSLYDSLREQSKYFKVHLKEILLYEKHSSSQELEMKKLIDSLIGILNSFKSDELKVPVVDLPVNEFINTLKEDLEEYNSVTVKIQNIGYCKELLSKFIQSMNDAIEHRKTIESIKEDMTSDDFDKLAIESELSELNSKIEQTSYEILELEKSALKNDFEPGNLPNLYEDLREDPMLDSYELYNKGQLEELIDDKVSKENKFRKDCRRLETLIKDKNEQVKRLEKKEPHKFQEHFLSINSILKHTLNLEKMFLQFDQFADKIISKKLDTTDASKEEELYLERVGFYLANKVDSIRHIDSLYKIRNIDVLLEIIETVDGKKIRFSDLGTGQGQATYLDTLLSMSGNKKIIALFDEVAMMDESSLGPIKDKLKDLYKKRKLLMAIIVQKGEYVEVESIV